MIRAKYFGYNDEVFYVAGNRIANVFDNKQQAELAYKKLEIDGARDFALYEVESLFDADEALLQQLDDFVYSRCGEHICEEGDISDDVLPASLSDDDTFEFIQLAGMQKFQLVEFENEPFNLEEFTFHLDQTQKSINTDYEAKRTSDLALAMPLVRKLPLGSFENWLKNKGKLGGQHKVPRLSNNRLVIEEILELCLSKV